ncbi:hypothetical protein EUX98_g7473 [Antrodiella citrinella]|uniref:Uncharacterized protein n=1 Tax=Antrodiella citrinella TaxID=2447956 RepID=A0A4S4MLF6_9APHY|nr:hypothetical protein EUX98_g7473 [Antrodiella citrinella]
MSGDTPIISKYELDLTDLTVYNFGTDRAGPLHKKWEELIRWSWTNYTEDHADYKEYEVIIGITSKGTRDGTVDTDPLIINGEVMIQVALFSDKALSKLRYVSHEVVERDRWSF